MVLLLLVVLSLTLTSQLTNGCSAGEYTHCGSSCNCVSCTPSATVRCNSNCNDCYYCGTGDYCQSYSYCECAACSPGTYSPQGYECLPCAAGTYNPNSGQSRCLPCIAGRLCPSGSSQPQPCSAGYYCPSNATKMLRCPPGSYCPPNSAAPLKCHGPQYCPTAGMWWPSYSASVSSVSLSRESHTDVITSSRTISAEPPSCTVTQSVIASRSVDTTSWTASTSWSLTSSATVSVPSSTTHSASRSITATEASLTNRRTLSMTTSHSASALETGTTSNSHSDGSTTPSWTWSHTISTTSTPTETRRTPSTSRSLSRTRSDSPSATKSFSPSSSESVFLSNSHSSTPSLTHSVSASISITPSTTLSVSIDPCNTTLFNTSSQIIALVEALKLTDDGGPIDTSQTLNVVNDSTALRLSSTAFQQLTAVSLQLHFRTPLRNFYGIVSDAWFTQPVKPADCLVSQVALINDTSLALSVSYDPTAAYFRLLTDDYSCVTVLSSDVFQCQLLTRQRFNFSLRVDVAGVAQVPYWVTLLTQIVALVASTVVGGQSMLQQSRTSTLQSMASCQYSLVTPADVFAHPLQFGFGPSPQFYRRGLVVGNLLFVAVIAAILVTAAKVRMARVAQESQETFLPQIVSLHGPAVLLGLYALLADGVVESGVSLIAIAWSPGLDVALGVMAVGSVESVYGVLMVGLVFRLRRILRLRALSDASDGPTQTFKGGLKYRLLDFVTKPSGTLETVSEDGKAAAEESAWGVWLQPVYEEYHVVWFTLTELAFTFGVSALNGVPRTTAGTCRRMSVALLVLYAVYVVLLALLRPHLYPFRFAVAVISEALCLGNCVLLFLSSTLDAQRIADAMRGVTAASYAVMWLQMLPTCIRWGALWAQYAWPWLLTHVKPICTRFADFVKALMRSKASLVVREDPNKSIEIDDLSSALCVDHQAQQSADDVWYALQQQSEDLSSHLVEGINKHDLPRIESSDADGKTESVVLTGDAFLVWGDAQDYVDHLYDNADAFRDDSLSSVAILS